MHKDLENAFINLVEIIKADGRCKGGWHYGSVGRGTSDIYSDYDPVFKQGFLVKAYRENDNPNWNSYLMEINK